MRYTNTLATSLLAAALAVAPVRAQEQGAKVPEAQARATALREVPGGRVSSEELEREGGHLIYSYDIVVAGKPGIEEVHVDALSGALLAHEHENAAAEAGEARQEGQAVEPGEAGERAEAGEAAEAGERAESGERGEAAEDQAALRRQARVSEAQARATAAARVPGGRLKDHELENEDGRLIYSFEFEVPGKKGIQEVNVDARTGTVVSVEHEGS